MRTTALAEIDKRRDAGMEQQALTLPQQQSLLAFERFIIAHDFVEFGEGAKQLADCLHKRVYDIDDHELARTAASTQLART
ncbi:MAG: hypothetical protein FJ271_28170 [Planctomycetes bacterium]|nr:hypothetical protein [Planctomycetota bacterium]